MLPVYAFLVYLFLALAIPLSLGAGTRLAASAGGAAGELPGLWRSGRGRPGPLVRR